VILHLSGVGYDDCRKDSRYISDGPFTSLFITCFGLLHRLADLPIRWGNEVKGQIVILFLGSFLVIWVVHVPYIQVLSFGPFTEDHRETPDPCMQHQNLNNV
jgi:hypothetical protein